MQTFLPVSSFEESAGILDYRRLGKQRVEARQILNALRNGGGWKNHPAVKMWRGYENALIAYGNAMICEWIMRDFKNTMEILDCGDIQELPLWFGLDKFHASHRSNLLRKDPEHYKVFGWSEPSDLPYFWPI